MKKISLGILAHVDAGKTTLTESMLYDMGIIRTAGRVDNGDAFLDTEVLEKKRGVTILSKQAVCMLDKDKELNNASEDVKITIIDTPGHEDFIGEAQRALTVLDAGVLLVSGPDGVTASTKRLAGMLRRYKVPYFVFVNKMDMCERPVYEIIAELNERLGDGFISFIDDMNENISSAEGSSFELAKDKYEEIASLSERTIEKYLEEGEISTEDIIELIYSGTLHPVITGSALKNQNVDKLINILTKYLPEIEYKDTFSAKVFKIGFEEGHKLSFAKITGGKIAVRSTIDDERLAGEKISQIRCYSGGKYENLDTAEAGDVVTFVGLENTFAGMGLGEESDIDDQSLRPVLRFELELPKEVSLRVFLPKLKELAMEDPLLQLEVIDEERVCISVMGDFQVEILKETILERYGVQVDFVKGSFVHKETIMYPVIGYGHFEPLRHYSEVQILMEPLPRGMGIEVASDLSVNELDINWQKTIISTITNAAPVGVLTGSELTDIRFTLIAGKAHLKHTDSQDFREAVRRAIRQGLMKTVNILLEPEFSFVIDLPNECVGRVMTEITDMGGKCTLEADGSLIGTAPARCIVNYQSKLTEYTSGRGTIELKMNGYVEIPDSEVDEILSEASYDPDSDKYNPSGSIFIDHGAGYYVPWYECEKLMHLPDREADYLSVENESDDERIAREAEIARRLADEKRSSDGGAPKAIGTDEIDSILRSATHSNAGKENRRTKRVYLTRNMSRYYGTSEARSTRDSNEAKGSNETKSSNEIKDKYSDKTKAKVKKKYLLVDGYNIIHAWGSLKELLQDGNGTKESQSIALESARYKLLDMMSEYKALKDTEIIVVFDAYNVRGGYTKKMDYLGVHVVYTKEAETADQYIARFTVENSKNFDITVATSDGMIQLIIRGEDSILMSAVQLEEDYKSLRGSALESVF